MSIGPHIGALRSRVTLLQPVVVAGKQTWTDWLTVWGSFDQQTGLEAAIAASNPTNIVTSVLRIRYVKGLKQKHRVRYAGRVLEIMSVIDPQERHRELHLVLKESAP